MVELASYLFLVSLLLAAAVTPLCARLARRWGVLDPPGPRKIHLEPVPLAGGWARTLARSRPVEVLSGGQTSLEGTAAGIPTHPAALVFPKYACIECERFSTDSLGREFADSALATGHSHSSTQGWVLDKAPNRLGQCGWISRRDEKAVDPMGDRISTPRNIGRNNRPSGGESLEERHRQALTVRRKADHVAPRQESGHVAHPSCPLDNSLADPLLDAVRGNGQRVSRIRGPGQGKPRYNAGFSQLPSCLDELKDALGLQDPCREHDDRYSVGGRTRCETFDIHTGSRNKSGTPADRQSQAFQLEPILVVLKYEIDVSSPENGRGRTQPARTRRTKAESVVVEKIAESRNRVDDRRDSCGSSSDCSV